VIKVTKASHGYDGFMGICVGHPSLIRNAQPMPAAPMPAAPMALPADAATGLLEYLQNAVREGTQMTASELLEVWNTRSQPAGEVSVGEGSPSVSEVTMVSFTFCPSYVFQYH
jgi:hypothetical protein